MSSAENDYTPATDEVRETYVYAYTRNHDARTTGMTREAREVELRTAFNSWLNRVRADAWDEALDEVSSSYTIPIPDNPYRKDTRS